MPLLRFLSQATVDAPRGALFAMTVLSGLATSGLLALLNLGAELAAHQGSVRLMLALTFLVLLVILLSARAFALNHLVVILEKAILNRRLRLVERLCHSHSQQHQGGTYLPLTQDIGMLSQAILFLAPLAESLLILAAMLAYLAWLSPTSLATVLIISALALPTYWRLFAHSPTRMRASRHPKLSAQIEQTWMFIGSRGLLYAMLLVLVFLSPLLVPEAGATVHQVTGAVLFMIAPLQHVVESLPVLSQVNAALVRLDALEDVLDDSHGKTRR